MIIREATIEDLGSITDLHCRSFTPADHVPMILGRRYITATYRWLLNSDRAYILVAEIDNKIVGLVAVCDGSFTKSMFLATLPEFILGIVSRPQRILSKQLWKRLFRKPDKLMRGHNIQEIPGFAQLTIVAVDSKYRGQGIFGGLVEKTRDMSKLRGSRAIRAGIYENNISSRKAFIKAGWQEAEYLKTKDTVFYVAILDDEFKKDLKSLLYDSRQ